VCVVYCSNFPTGRLCLYYRWQSVVGANSNIFGLQSIIHSNGLTNHPVTELRSDLMTGNWSRSFDRQYWLLFISICLLGILSTLPQMYQSEDSPRIPFGVAQIGYIILEWSSHSLILILLLDKVFRLEEFLGPFRY
jgi:hypothetical protein